MIYLMKYRVSYSTLYIEPSIYAGCSLTSDNVHLRQLEEWLRYANVCIHMLMRIIRIYSQHGVLDPLG